MARNNIFKNSQNVHVRSIEESVQKIIDKLSAYYPSKNKIYSFEDARDALFDFITEKKVNKEDRESVEGSITRIIIDRSVYGTSNMTLSTIFARVWTYIENSEHSTELKKRMVEELIESNNKCASGYAARLVNTLSGFDEEMTVSISYEDQIISNLEARLNEKIKVIDDPEKLELILEEMTIPPSDYRSRKNFLLFFRENISAIREGMYNEFCKHMSDLDYDMYFRKAIIHYEGCS